MKFSCNATELSNAFKNMQRLMPTLLSVNIHATEKGVLVIGSAAGSYVEINIGGKTEKSDKVTADLLTVQGALKGRGEMKFEKKGGIHFKCGSYSGNFATLPYENIKRTDPSKGLKLSEKQQEVLTNMISFVSIVDIDKNGEKPPIILNFAEDYTTVACSTRIHASVGKTAAIKAKQMTKNIQHDFLPGIIQIANKKPFTLGFDNISMIASNENMLVSVPTFTTVAIGFDAITKMVSNVVKTDKEVIVKGDVLLKSLDNLLSFYENKSAVALTAKKGSFTLATSNGNAEVKEEIPCKGQYKDCKFNPVLVKDLLKGIKGEFKLGITGSNMVFKHKADDVSYVMLCAGKN